MAPKQTDEELNKLFEGIGGDDDDHVSPNNDAPSTTGKATPASSAADAEDDPLAELKNLAAAPRLSSSSRPGTPRMMSSTATSATGRGRATPPSTGSARNSEERSAIDQDKGKQPQPTAPAPAAAAAAGSWWGGLSALATSAVKQAEAAVKEISSNEEALKWAEQMRGNYEGLRGIGGSLSSRALPTFTGLLHTLAPPISQHERLQIHITHDLVRYPSLDPLIYATFSRVMSQVEGGDLMVIQRGSEASARREDAGYTGSGQTGWNDGPWWRENDSRRSLSAVKGLAEGTKLVRVSAETYANDFYAARGGLEEAAKHATAGLSESNPVRSSDIFLAIQAINHPAPADLFGGHKLSEQKDAGKPVGDESESVDTLLSFAVFLHDPIHSITFSALSQPVPQKWAEWLDAPSTTTKHDGTSFVAAPPDEIKGIVDAGGVDPREWVSEWLEEVLSLAVGVVAQRYVARRMGVGEGALGRSKRHEEIVESGGGEAARAI